MIRDSTYVVKLSVKRIGRTLYQGCTPEKDSRHATDDDQRCQISAGLAFVFEARNINSNAPKNAYVAQ